MDEKIYIPLSYITQYNYCKRRAGLLLLREQWNENEFTASGRAEHEKVHDCRIEKHGNVLFMYETTLYSDSLMLSGKSDCIEGTSSEIGVKLPCADGKWLLYPVEYKHGIVRNEYEYKLQLTAQAMCLEEMIGGTITEGAIFYIDSHRRDEVIITDEMRKDVISTAKALHDMHKSGKVSSAKWSAKCSKCSLLDLCCPKLKNSAGSYIEGFYFDREETDK